MNFLFVLDFFTPSKGGVEKVFEGIIGELVKRNHHVKVLTSKFRPDLKSYEKNENLEIYRIGKNRLEFSLKAPFFGIKLLKNIDIIHTSTYNAAYVTKFLSFFSSAPVIITSHEIIGKSWYDFKGKKGFIYEKIEDLIYKFGFHYCFVTNHVKNVAISKYKLNLKNITTVYNGLEKIKINKKISKSDLGFKENDILGVFCGRPGWTKGLDFLLDNFDEIKKLNKNFKLLLLVLEKNNKEKIDKILKKIKNKEDVKILYEIAHQDVYAYENIADIGIVPSRTEGFGFTALEFSTLKKSNVFSFVGGIPEVNFGDCHFFKVNDKTGFINCFKEIFQGKKNNYSYDRKLTVEKMFSKYYKIYKKLTN